MFVRLLSVCFILALAGCATRTMTFKANEPADVSLVSFADLNTDEESLGKTPITVELARISGKVVRISAPGKQPFYWAIADQLGDTNETNVKLVINPGARTADNSGEAAAQRQDSKSKTNRLLRLVMQAYKELSGERYQSASQIADQIAQIDPEIAAPHLIKGIAAYHQNDPETAKASLLKAKALDPEDQNIDQVMTSLNL